MTLDDLTDDLYCLFDDFLDGAGNFFDQVMEHPVITTLHYGLGADIARAGEKTRQKLFKQRYTQKELEAKLGSHHAFQLWRTLYLRWPAVAADISFLSGAWTAENGKTWIYSAGIAHGLEFACVMLNKAFNLKDIILGVTEAINNYGARASAGWEMAKEYYDGLAGVAYQVNPFHAPIPSKKNREKKRKELVPVDITMEQAYSRLGIAETASPDDIRASYRRIALETHPDRHSKDPEKEARFKRTTEAYKLVRRARGF
ncbi:MAG: J domain-containing protein [Candidatus Woesearchaeota archaeon]|nr:J domain-containing protein [Candidatus Woesearchaeota archaeon]